MCVINCEEEKLKLDVPLAEVNRLHIITPQHLELTRLEALKTIRFNLSWSAGYGPAMSRNVSVNTILWFHNQGFVLYAIILMHKLTRVWL